MEFVDGATLDRRRMTPRDAAAHAREIALAVHAAHGVGVIHRDLKPSNVMLDSAGRIRVLDFGLARRVEGGSTLTASGMMVGTPSYMAPEQARGERADARSDVYGLGATLYELLTGRAPFAGGDVLSIVMRVIEDDPLPPRRLAPEIAPELEAVVLKCLEKDPAHRFESAQELADDLDRWLRGEPVIAGRSGILRRVARRYVRRRWVIPAAAVALLAAGVPILLALRARADTATRDQLAELRRASSTCLQAALDLRRLGNLDGMTRHAEQLEAACREATARLPASAEPFALLGRMRRAQMRNGDALALQDEALRLEPRHPLALYERVVLRGGRYRDLLEGLRREEERRIPAGRVDIAKVAERSADARALRAAIVADVDAMPEGGSECTRAIARWARGAIPEAASGFIRATATDPDAEEAWEWAAELESQAFRWDEAERILTEAIAHDKGYVPFLEQRSQIRLRLATNRQNAPELKLRGYEAALADADAAVGLAPHRANAWFVRGEARSGVGVLLVRFRRDGAAAAFRQAVEDYTKALELGADRGETLVARGGARENLGHSGGDAEAHYLSAIADFDEALRSSDKNPTAWAFRGGAWHGLADIRQARGEDPARELDQSLRDYHEALTRDPRDGQTWLARASALVTRGRREGGPRREASMREAIEYCHQAAKLAPQVAESWHRAGSIRLNLVDLRVEEPGEDYRLGVAELTRALELDSSIAEAWQDRGGLHVNYAAWLEARGRPFRREIENACGDFDKALALSPGLPAARRWRFNARCQLAGVLESSGGDPTALLRGALDDADLAFPNGPASGLEWHRIGWACYHLAFRTPAERPALYERSAAALAASVKLEPRVVLTWVQLGAARVNLGLASAEERQEPLYRSAEEALTQAIDLAPRSAIARCYRGNARLNLANALAWRGAPNRAALEGALEDYEEAMRLDPSWKKQAGPNAETVRKLLGR
jgi:serine/threonine-protein kinase